MPRMRHFGYDTYRQTLGVCMLLNKQEDIVWKSELFAENLNIYDILKHIKENKKTTQQQQNNKKQSNVLD